MTFHNFVVVDWSASAVPSPKTPKKDAIYSCAFTPAERGHPVYHRTRSAAMDAVTGMLDAALAAGQRTLIGFDFAFGYPIGFAAALTGRADAFAVWDWFARHITDDVQNANNRFAVADRINRMLSGCGPFWGCPAAQETDALPQKGSTRQGHGMAERRVIEQHVPSAQSVWKLFTTGSVGSQVMMGLPRLQALRARFGANLQVWPFDTGFAVPTAPIVVVEIYPSMMPVDRAASLAAQYPDQLYHIADAVQVRDVCETIVMLPDAAFTVGAALPRGDEIAREEGWIFGAPVAKVAG